MKKPFSSSQLRKGTLLALGFFLVAAGVVKAADGTLSIGNGFMIFKQQGNTDEIFVGVGTADPAEKLEVVGNIKAEGLTIPTNADFGKVLTSDDEGNATWQDSSSSATSCSVVSEADWVTETSSLSCAGDTKVSGALVEWESKAGIYQEYLGIQYDAAKTSASVDCLGRGCRLHIICCEGATAGTGSDTLADLSCGDGEIAKFDGSVWRCADDTGGKFVDGSDANNAVYNEGNVGIGTANPQAALEVEGYIRGEFECVRRTGNDTEGLSYAQCQADEFLMSGGGDCGPGGFAHRSFPKEDLTGWQFDCYGVFVQEDVNSRAYAICCKK